MRKITRLLLGVTIFFTFVNTGTAKDLIKLPMQYYEAIRGLKMGQFRLIPIVGVMGEYYSNIFRNNTNVVKAEAITPQGGLTFRNSSSNIIKLRLNALVKYRKIFSSDKNAEKLSSTDVVSGLNINLLPAGVFGIVMEDNFIKSMVPRNYSTTQNLDHIANMGKISMRLTPGHGVLSLFAYYSNQLTHFMSYDRGNFVRHSVGGSIKWDFLPKTSIIIDVSKEFIFYNSNFNVDSAPLKAKLGLSGYVTARLAVDLEAGFTKGYYKKGEDYSAPFGEVNFDYMIGRYTILHLGYTHYYMDSYYGNYYSVDRGEIKFSQQIAHRVDLLGGFAYNYLSFATYVPDPTQGVSVSSPNRKEHLLQGSFIVKTSILKYFGLIVGYQYSQLLSDYYFIYTDKTTGKAIKDGTDYTLHYIYGGLRLYY